MTQHAFLEGSCFKGKVWRYTCRICAGPGETSTAANRKVHPGACERAYREITKQKKRKPCTDS